MAKIERCGISISFEDLKAEFRAMDDEIKDKAEEIVQLRQALIEAQKRWAAKEKEAAQNIGEMEELHENLVELDQRFERSEALNLQLREELDAMKSEVQHKNQQLAEQIKEAENSLRASMEEREKLKEEFLQFKEEANARYEEMRSSLKTSIEGTVESIKVCLERRRSQRFRRKGKCYKTLKAVVGDLEAILGGIGEESTIDAGGGGEGVAGGSSTI